MKNKKLKRLLVVAGVCLLATTSMTACSSVKILNKGEVYIETNQVRANKFGDTKDSMVAEITILEEDALRIMDRIQKEQLTKPNINFGKH